MGRNCHVCSRHLSASDALGRNVLNNPLALAPIQSEKKKLYFFVHFLGEAYHVNFSVTFFGRSLSMAFFSVGVLLTQVCMIQACNMNSAVAAAAPAQDREAILKHAGCFEVTFDFVETIPLTPGYKLRAPYHNQAMEYVVVDQDTGDRISLQHILVFRGAVQKHWRQEWTYQAPSRYNYVGNQTWNRVDLSTAATAGQWTQKVFNVDDSPRYECSAPWIHWGDQHYWECETDRPLPRREYSARNDYQIVQARNRQQLRSDGWILEEDNGKVVLANGKRSTLVEEKGKNQFFRVADARCKAGVQYWQESQGVWNAIVRAWNEVYSTHATLTLATPAPQGKPELYEALFELADRATQVKSSPQAIRTEAASLIQTYVTK